MKITRALISVSQRGSAATELLTADDADKHGSEWTTEHDVRQALPPTQERHLSLRERVG